ncbi:MAG: nitroreductase family protein [Candidatus Bathyarchaeota archaeon]|nr:MAG: nitroreductase family protein [Candidatus Bathyarchaeota archaeon]
MALVDKILSRRSVRRYEKRALPQDVLDKILEAGRQAPTASNRQAWHFIVITDADVKTVLSQKEVSPYSPFIKDAPIAIVGCAWIGDDEYNQRWGTIYSIIDTIIALQNMVIAAWAMGVGSCWVGVQGVPIEDKVRQLLNVPSEWKIMAVITFGYPAEQSLPRKKKSLEEIVSYNTFKKGHALESQG